MELLESDCRLNQAEDGMTCERDFRIVTTRSLEVYVVKYCGIREKAQVLIPSLIYRQRSRSCLSHFAVSFQQQLCAARPSSGPFDWCLREAHEGSFGYIA